MLDKQFCASLGTDEVAEIEPIGDGGYLVRDRTATRELTSQR